MAISNCKCHICPWISHSKRERSVMMSFLRKIEKYSQNQTLWGSDESKSCEINFIQISEIRKSMCLWSYWYSIFHINHKSCLLLGRSLIIFGHDMTVLRIRKPFLINLKIFIKINQIKSGLVYFKTILLLQVTVEKMTLKGKWAFMVFYVAGDGSKIFYGKNFL